jgi:hypothetical protein
MFVNVIVAAMQPALHFFNIITGLVYNQVSWLGVRVALTTAVAPYPACVAMEH